MASVVSIGRTEAGYRARPVAVRHRRVRDVTVHHRVVLTHLGSGGRRRLRRRGGRLRGRLSRRGRLGDCISRRGSLGGAPRLGDGLLRRLTHRPVPGVLRVFPGARLSDVSPGGGTARAMEGPGCIRCLRPRLASVRGASVRVRVQLARRRVAGASRAFTVWRRTGGVTKRSVSRAKDKRGTNMAANISTKNTKRTDCLPCQETVPDVHGRAKVERAKDAESDHKGHFRGCPSASNHGARA